MIEVLAATLILATSGLALTEFLGGGLRAVSGAVRREQEIADEERLLAAYALLGRSDLDQRLGDAPVGMYVVSVQRPERTLYRIALRRAMAYAPEDLVTVVYRPGDDDAP